MGQSGCGYSWQYIHRYARYWNLFCRDTRVERDLLRHDRGHCYHLGHRFYCRYGSKPSSWKLQCNSGRRWCNQQCVSIHNHQRYSFSGAIHRQRNLVHCAGQSVWWLRRTARVYRLAKLRRAQCPERSRQLHPYTLSSDLHHWGVCQRYWFMEQRTELRPVGAYYDGR